MKRWRTWIIVGGILLLAGVAVVVILRLRNASQGTTFTEIVEVKRGDLVASITPTGEVSTERRAELSFNVSRVELTELTVTPGQQVHEGDVLARIDTQELERAVEQADADLLSAEEALAQAQAPYTELDRQKAELDVANAEVALQQAQQSVDDDALAQAEYDLKIAQLNLTIAMHSSAVGKNVRDLEYSVAWHERELRDLEAQLQQGKVEQTAVDKESQELAETQADLEIARITSETTLAAAQDKVTDAEKALAELQTGSDTLAQAQARNNVAQAEYNLAKTKETLANITAGPDAKTVQLAESKYEAAQANLEEAQAALQAATMVAPFDGTIISVGAETGDLVSSSTNIITIADLTDLKILASIDETDISQVQVGQDVQITFDAFSGYRFTGKVLEVPLEGTLQQSIVTYDVVISLDDTQGVALRSGMTANLTIVTGRRDNVLLVPVLAIWQADEGSVVIAQVSPGVTVQVPVQLGLSDGTYVEVTSGLLEGDNVVVQYELADNETGSFNRVIVTGGMGIPGGGIGR